MPTIPRSVLRRFRALCRRGGPHKPTVGPVVTFVGAFDGCRIRAASTDEVNRIEPSKGSHVAQIRAFRRRRVAGKAT